jgi:hypothetical protein
MTFSSTVKINIVHQQYNWSRNRAFIFNDIWQLCFALIEKIVPKVKEVVRDNTIVRSRLYVFYKLVDMQRFHMLVF